MAHLTAQADALLKRVRRIAGQIAGIERAIEASADCAETLHLIAGARGAINGLLDEVIAAHLREHVAGADLTGEQRARGADEVLAAIRRYAK